MASLPFPSPQALAQPTGSSSTPLNGREFRMATNVTHRLPTPQDQAIADLTGYEDAATVGKRKARYPCGYVSSRSPFR